MNHRENASFFQSQNLAIAKKKVLSKIGHLNIFEF